MDADDSTFLGREPVNDQKYGLDSRLIRIPLTQAYGFSEKVMAELPLTPR